ncbi:hypothetical protein M514_09003 [Trichuris suis]|uniref:Uncharacterized protein n=1 Tax=Trichuris suis TaxID=68888 RepID=A0A085MZ67_9BILA|nr:hypothetical protein M513_09003 [Trichuris suis]KFD62513.1 hypothetical protein M514_09003 [Trichuris suis]
MMKMLESGTTSCSITLLPQLLSDSPEVNRMLLVVIQKFIDVLYSARFQERIPDVKRGLPVF